MRGVLQRAKQMSFIEFQLFVFGVFYLQYCVLDTRWQQFVSS